MRRAALAQGLYYVTTGIWPVVHLRSFEAVSGPKRDRWLVRTTGALIAAIGTALLVGARQRRRRDPTLETLGVASAATLAAADVVFVATGQIPRVYLGDAVAEAALIALWFFD